MAKQGAARRQRALPSGAPGGAAPSVNGGARPRSGWPG